MTKEQADLFFPYSPDDDLEDLWEQRLFEQKQFFLTRPPIRMVWMSRIKKLEKQFQAFLVLTEQEKTEDIVPIQIKNELIFSEYFVAAFHQFHKQRNSYKSELLQAQSYNALVELIERWLSTELEYAKYWIVEESKNNDIEAIRSKEPDPM